MFKMRSCKQKTHSATGFVMLSEALASLLR